MSPSSTVALYVIVTVSQAMTVILESTRQQGRRGFGPFYCTAASNTVPNIESAALNDLEGIVEPSE
jgi:hypothetical protein